MITLLLINKESIHFLILILNDFKDKMYIK